MNAMELPKDGNYIEWGRQTLASLGDDAPSFDIKIENVELSAINAEQRVCCTVSVVVHTVKNLFELTLNNICFSTLIECVDHAKGFALSGLVVAAAPTSAPLKAVGAATDAEVDNMEYFAAKAHLLAAMRNQGTQAAMYQYIDSLTWLTGPQRAHLMKMVETRQGV